MGTVFDITDLPTDLFLIVTRYLDPIDFVRCRLVSKSWHREFIDESLLRSVLASEYREVRDLHALLDREAEHTVDQPPGDQPPGDQPPGDQPPGDQPPGDQPPRDHFDKSRNIWIRTFDRVLARRLALKTGRPRSVTNRSLRGGLTNRLKKQAHIRIGFVPVYEWSRYHRQPSYHTDFGRIEGPDDQVPTDLLETDWTYDSGLLVYPDMAEVQAYILLDIEQNTLSIVPFDIKNRVVRRVRLKHKILIIEWAEKEPYHRLNEHEEVHRHYVTAFDVQSAKHSIPKLTQWEITFRSEWKLHYLGFPLPARDCWYSDHSTTHYAVYIWQNNGSVRGENEPIESLLIWDISQPSSYRPSEDPSGGGQVSVGAQLVKELSNLDLDFLTIRQRDTPFLRKIALDGSACVYFFEEGCGRERGPHVGHGYEVGRRNPGDAVWERIVGIPVLGPGPCWEDRQGIRSTSAHERQYPSFRIPDPLLPNRATCWRYEGMYSGIRNQVVRNVSSDIQYFVLQIKIGFPEIWVSSDSGRWCTEISLRDIQWRWQRIDGDENYLIIQSNDELHVLHFDCDVWAGR